MFDEPSNESLSKEYIEKNFGYLKDAKNQPLAGETIATGALSSPAVLQAIAEINSTEFSIGKLDAKTLKAKYQEQLSNFEAVRRPALEREGQPAVVIDQLREIYTVRANVSMWELEQAVKELGFLDGKELRVTKRSLESFPVWKVLGLPSPMNTDLINPAGAVAPKSNEEYAAENVRLLRGARGLATALQKGLSEEQYNHLFAQLETKVVSPARAAELLQKVEQFRASLPSKKLSRSELKSTVAPFLDSLAPPEREYLLKLSGASKEVAIATTSSLPEKYEPEEFRGRVAEVSKKLKAQNPGLAPRVERLEQAVEFILKPENQRKLRLLDLLGRVELSKTEQEQLLAPFADKSLDDALLNDVQNAHPIAERLWGDRMAWMASDNVNYTKHYEDVSDNGLFKDSHDVDQVKLKKVESKRYDAPILGPYPFNSGIEEVIHWKLQLLAEKFLGFDLSTDLGIAQFDSFVHNYEVSPGEDTLDRVHGYPPPLHTYDELPIIKFDGWDEADVPEDYPEYVAQQQAAAKAKPVH